MQRRSVIGENAETIVFVESVKNRRPIAKGLLLAAIYSLALIFVSALVILNSMLARPSANRESASSKEVELTRPLTTLKPSDEQRLERNKDYELKEGTLEIMRENESRISKALTVWKVEFLSADFDIKSAQSDAILSNSSTGHLKALAARSRIRIAYASFADDTSHTLIKLGDISISKICKAGYSNEFALQEVSAIIKPLMLEMHKILRENPAPKF